MDSNRPLAQHRVSAWRGALQIMRDHPLGVGWNKAVNIYGENYSPPEDGAGAIITNSYLMVGTELGLPGVLCFVAYVGLCLKNRPHLTLTLSPPTGSGEGIVASLATCHLPLQTACRAGAIVLLVAFWFDGGLFTLATAAVFWVLLELSQVRSVEYGVRSAETGQKIKDRRCKMETEHQQVETVPKSSIENRQSKILPAGFTLIELLVVIGIIGILAGLVMAATVRAKDKGARVTDINNLRQMTIALQLYAGDNQDSLPWSNWAAGDQPDRHGWLYTKSDSLAVLAPGESAFKVQTGVFWPILQNPKLYFCPRDGPNVPHFQEREQQISSYVMNGAVNGYERVIYPPTKLGQMSATGVVFWETDETVPSYFNDGASQPKEGISKRHNNGAINANFSGSVGFISFADWYLQANGTIKNDLWCFPSSTDGH